jgi:hypothetical protein
MNAESIAKKQLPALDADNGKLCRRTQILIVIVATMLHGIFLSKAKPLQSANDRSRWCTVWSLIDRGTFQIDEIRQHPGWDTIDLVLVNGHFYSTKPSLLTCLVAGITWCVQHVTGWNLLDQTQSVTFVVLLVTNLFPFVISLFAWIAILERVSESIWTRLFALTAAAFATLLTPFLMTLNNHTVAAASTMVALYALIRILKASPNHTANWPFVLCGLATAWTAANELPAACFGVGVFALTFRTSAKKTLCLFLPAAAIPVVALVTTNYLATGSWKPFYADFGTEKYRFVYEGVPSYWSHPHGIDRNLDDPLTYFMHCTVGHHGLFSLTPLALLAIAGWLISFRVRDRALRLLLWLGAVTSAVVLAFYLTRTANYNYGGVSCALRWALWLTPFWLLAIVPVLDVCRNSIVMRGISGLLVAVSIFSAWQPIDNPWSQPWLFQWLEARGWIDYSDEIPELSKPLWTWFSTLPESTSEEPAWVEFSVAQPAVAPRFIRLTARPDSTAPAGERVEIEVRETTGDGPPDRIRTLQIERAQFNEGAPPADFLNWSDPNVTSARQQADLSFVRGLPRKVPYRLRAVRYLKTSVRREAFQCQHVAAHVAYSVNENDQPLHYRCESWLTDDLPFGVAQVVFHIVNPENNSVQWHEQWTVRDCWPKPQPYKKP